MPTTARVQTTARTSGTPTDVASRGTGFQVC
jgi:hypothetical protein